MFTVPTTLLASRRLVSIAVTPAGAATLKGATRTYVATGTYSVGPTADLSALVTFAPSDVAKATFSGAVLTGVAGTAGTPITITATLGAIVSPTVTATISVRDWALVTPSVTPTARRGSSTFEDPAGLDMMGGTIGAGGGSLGLTELQFVTATPNWVTPGGLSGTPPNGGNAQGCYDSAQSKYIYLNSRTSVYPVTGTTTWQRTLAGAWTDSGNNLPEGRSDMALVFDSVRNVQVCYGGYSVTDSVPTIKATFLERSSGAWSTISPSSGSPLARVNMAACFDEARGVMVIFGGAKDVAGVATNTTDTATWDGANYVLETPVSSPGATSFCRMAYDKTRQVCVLFTGNQTWEWDGTNWTQIVTPTTPASRSLHMMGWDAPAGAIILMGGYDGNNRSDTYKYVVIP